MTFIEQDAPDRFSVISSSSSTSENKDDSTSPVNSFGVMIKRPSEAITSNQNISWIRKYLFLGPLILCLILLTIGIVIFVTVQQKSKSATKSITAPSFQPFNSTSYHDYTPISCSSANPDQHAFVLSESKCASHRSSLIQIYYSRHTHPLQVGEAIPLATAIASPIIRLDFKYFSHINLQFLVLLVINPTYTWGIPPYYWIRSYSVDFEDGRDICQYRLDIIKEISQDIIILIYGTNSSLPSIRAKTNCQLIHLNQFKLTDYVTFVKLKLLAATSFRLLISKSDDDVYNENDQIPTSN